MTTSELSLERRAQENRTGLVEGTHATVMIAPDVREDYWEYRVKLTDKQAVVGFPKYTTVGIGFAVEGSSWNTNLPYIIPTETILEHIWRNRGPSIHEGVANRERVAAAIRLIQTAAFEDQLAALYPVTTEELVEQRERLLNLRREVLGDDTPK